MQDPFMNQLIQTNNMNPVAKLFPMSDTTLIPMNQMPFHSDSMLDWLDPIHGQEGYQAITLMKRRVKKMNKHKLKKRRRLVRYDTRYNKEKARQKRKAERRKPFDPSLYNSKE